MEALKERKQRDIWSDDLDRGKQGMKEDMTKIEEQMKEGFAAVDKRFEKVDKRFDKIDKRFDKVDREMKAGFARADDRLEKAFEKADQRLERAIQVLGEQMKEGFANVQGQTEARMDRLESRRAKFQGGIWGVLGAAIGTVVTAGITHFT